jgi:hypothetical protein
MSNQSQEQVQNEQKIIESSNHSSKDGATQLRFDLLSQLFVHNSPGKYFQKPDGKHPFVNEVVTEEDILDHLSGKKVLGIPLQFTETDGSFVKNIIIDLYLRSEIHDVAGFSFGEYKSLLEKQMAVLSAACQLFAIPHYIESSGYKGYHLHIFLNDYMPIEKARRLAFSLFGSDIIDNNDKNKMAWEIFLKSEKAGSKSQFKLPYALLRTVGKKGIHRVS